MARVAETSVDERSSLPNDYDEEFDYWAVAGSLCSALEWGMARILVCLGEYSGCTTHK